MTPAGKPGPRKTLIAQTGFDGTGEEMFYSIGRAALERGYNLIIFEGPGQGGALRAQGLHFRHEWEKAVTPVVDFALRQKEVDPGESPWPATAWAVFWWPGPRRSSTGWPPWWPIRVRSACGQGIPQAKGHGLDGQASRQGRPGFGKVPWPKARACAGFSTTACTPAAKRRRLNSGVLGRLRTGDLVKKITSPTLVIVSRQDILLDVKSQSPCMRS